MPFQTAFLSCVLFRCVHFTCFKICVKHYFSKILKFIVSR
nr:MAG TPA: N terminus of Notch ligand [Caudoviricetes sp.]